jgi:hypothetical protein
MNLRSLFSDWRCKVLTVFLFSPAFLSVAVNLQLVSALDDSNNVPASANGDSYFPIISPDGRYVLFESKANNLVLTNNNGPIPSLILHPFNVFLRDRTNGTTTLVSVNLAGNGGDWHSLPCGISTNGQYALFEGEASDLVANDNNNVGDVFVRDLVNNTTTLVSVNTNGVSGNGVSRSSVMTPDGRFVAFVSRATDLVANDTNGISDVFVRDLRTGTTTLASVGATSTGSTPLSSRSESPVITPDGRFVAFYSTATNLVPGLQLTGDVYVRDLVAGTTTWASTDARTLSQSVFGTTNVISYGQASSADGRYIAFETCNISSNFRGMILRYDTQTHLTAIVHTNANVPADSSYADFNTLDMTPDGRFVAFVANTNVFLSGNTIIYLWDAQTGKNTLVSSDRSTGLPVAGVCDTPVVNPTGRYVAFFCSAIASNLATNTLVGWSHLYVRDTQAGSTQLIDADANGVGVGIGSTFAMSADGRLVAFDLANENLVPNDRNRDNDVFVRDVTAGTTELISAHHPALPSQTPNRFSTLFSTSVSTNARYIAFASEADNLVVNDTNNYRDVFVRDLLLGTNILVSVGTNGFAAAGFSTEPSISGDGRFVVFSSFAANLVPDDTNRAQDLFLRDLQAGTNSLVSAGTNGGFGNANSYSPIISSDGKYVLFRSRAQNLAAGSSGSGAENLFLRNLQLRTNYAMTTGSVVNASMTPDGHFIAFVGVAGGSGFTNLYVWDSQAAKKIFTNTFSALTNVSISADGRWVAAVSGQTLYAFDLIGKTNCSISAGPFDFRAGLQFSADDRFLAFVTKRKVVAADTNGTYDVYLHDFQTGTNLLVSRSFNSTNAANGASDSPSISPDGRLVVYRSSASNIVPNDTNSASDMFLYDRVNDATILVSVNQAGTSTANNWSLIPVFSGDGNTLAFESYASNLPGPGFNEFSAIFTLNLSPPVLVDSDRDGMDDQWEMDHFGTLARDGTGDFDGDGATDLFEFLTGTDPTDPASVFRAEIISVATSGQSSVITWPLASGKSYRVQFKNDLNDANWQDLNGNITLVGNQGYATDLAPATGQKFYRIILNN